MLQEHISWLSRVEHPSIEMQLINTAIPLFLVVLQLAMVGRAAPPADVVRVYHCACYILLHLRALIHLFEGDKPGLVSPSDENLHA